MRFFLPDSEDCLVEYQGKLRAHSDFSFLPFLVFASLALARGRLNLIWERNKLVLGDCGVEVCQPDGCCSQSHASEGPFLRFFYLEIKDRISHKND